MKGFVDLKKFLLFLIVFALFITSFSISNLEEDLDSLSVTVTSELKELKLGDKGDEVRQLQTRLKDLKYFLNKVDGKFGKGTMEAVKKVQIAYEIEKTGVADKQTLEIIYGDCYRPLEKGAEGKDVSRLQTRLNELGYYKGKISGRYQEATISAVKQFQKQNSMNENGKADVFLQDKLFSDDVVMAKGDDAVEMTPSPKKPIDLKFPGEIPYGTTKSDAVRQVQDRLRELGYFTRKSTGGFYRNTSASIKAFQAKNGVQVNGRIDEATWNALYAADAVSAKGKAKPTPVPEKSKYALEVDVRNQLVKIFELDEKGEYSRFVRAMWCSTGTRSFPSTVGTFTLTKRRVPWAEFPNWGGGKARYWTKINEDIAFHSVIYSSNKTDAVNMKSVRALGRRASHGCIRLTLQDAKWIYYNCLEGTQVRIFEDGFDDPEMRAFSKPAPYSTKLSAHPITPAPQNGFEYSASKPPVEKMRVLKKGAKGDDVYWLQYRLKELGFLYGEPTGLYLEGTQAAVSRYRVHIGLGSSGTADIELLRRIYEEAVLEANLPTPLPTDAPSQ